MNAKVIKELVRAQPKTFILILVLLLSNVGLYLYVAAYQTPRLESLQRAWLEKRKSARGGPALDTAAVYRQGENDLKLWQARIMQKKDFTRFVGSLFQIAANNSLAFKGVSYKPSQVKEEKLVSYSLGFDVSGKYAAVKSFISDLGRMREIMTIDNISLNAGKEAEGVVALKVQLTVYLRTEEQ
ncbi:MAG TPA: type 4a pilus biogenesis protein PilO [Geobacteraceae bacterium]